MLAAALPREQYLRRLQTEAGDATAIRTFENENLLVNMSVWRDIESLSAFVYHSAHVELMRRRREWFERMDEAFMALWWVPAGHRRGIVERIARLELLRSKGPTAEGFTFRQAFAAPDAARSRPPAASGYACPATESAWDRHGLSH
jgi:hypothetical protein